MSLEQSIEKLAAAIDSFARVLADVSHISNIGTPTKPGGDATQKIGTPTKPGTGKAPAKPRAKAAPKKAPEPEPAAEDETYDADAVRTLLREVAAKFDKKKATDILVPYKTRKVENIDPENYQTIVATCRLALDSLDGEEEEDFDL